MNIITYQIIYIRLMFIALVMNNIIWDSDYSKNFQKQFEQLFLNLYRKKLINL